MRWGHTFRHFYALHGLVVNGTSSFLDQFVSLKADVKDLSALDTERDKFFHHIIDNVCRTLGRRMRMIMTFFRLVSLRKMRAGGQRGDHNQQK